jgi:hypothetical protein
MQIPETWQFQSQRRSRSWLANLRIQRLDTIELLEDNPSLKSYLEEALSKSYLKAVELAVRETDLPRSTFPGNCPYSLAEILDNSFYPGEKSELINE